MSDLQDAISRLTNEILVTDEPDHSFVADARIVIAAARLVANPDYERAEASLRGLLTGFEIHGWPDDPVERTRMIVDAALGITRTCWYRPTGGHQMRQPLFITRMDDDEKLTLLVRLPGDEDWFDWGPITDAQKVSLMECGVFELTPEDIG